MTERVIEVEHISKSYLLGTRDLGYKTLRDAISRGFRRTQPRADVNELWALSDVSFQLDQGEALGLIGRNGSGKSTLLKILSRITHPTAGRVRLRGRVACLLEVGTGFHPELTGRENIYLNGAILGMTRQEIRNRFDEIVAFADIERFLDTPVKRYSSGMYVRLAFAVAAHLETEILIVDEVLAVGDAEFQRRCLGRMSEVARSGRTVLFVSHNLSSVEYLCTRAVLLSGGRLIGEGKPAEMIAQYVADTGRTASSWDLSQTPDRQGSGNVRMTAIELLDAEGQSLPQAAFCQPFRLRIHFAVESPIDDPEFGFAVLNDRGDRVFVVSSADSGFTMGILATSGAVDCVVDHPNLLPGVYRFEVWIIEVRGVSFADHVTMVGEMEVVLGDWSGPNVGEMTASWRGSVYVPSAWARG